ncbi:MAG: sigma-54-dependent Fis family transcriptional regulator [Deltaproteobacteria bacterium]|nr:sigma-54-dependent Fis family transcriptional regulator [Deltaproteobacteria bacterium]
MYPILVVEDSEEVRNALSALLTAEGYSVAAVGSCEEALRSLKHLEYSLILTDLHLPAKSGLDLLSEVRSMDAPPPVIVLTAQGTIEHAVEAMKLGARDFISKPFQPESLLSKISSILRPAQPASRGIPRPDIFRTKSPAVEEVLRQAKRVAGLNSSVLISGESGTGKELLARYIHAHSPRREREFLGVNCGSIPGELLESELFGHESGAFTGATERRVGLFEAANDGSLFLDEIGNMPSSLQMKLLRTLQESEVRRVGGTKTFKVDVRVISATNTDLSSEIKGGRFREDLFYRLGVVILAIPPLRERPEDIPLLADHFIERFGAEFNKKGLSITQSGLRALQRHPWPGNVRELENAIQRAMIFSDGPLTSEDFDLRSPFQTHVQNRSLHEVSAEASKKAEVQALLDVLARTQGNKLRAAKMLGVSYKTLLNKVRDYDLDESKSAAEELDS